MFRGIYERFLGCVVHLADKGHSLVRHVQSTISGVRSPSWNDLSKGFSIDFGLTLLILGQISYFIWGFDYLDRLYDKVVMTLLPAVLPPLAFFGAMRQERDWRRLDWWYVGFVFFLALAIGLAISEKFDLDALGINVVVIMTSFPWLFIFGKMVRGKRILAIGMVPAGVILMSYWVVSAFSNDLELRYLLISLPAISLITAAWTFLVWILFKGVDMGARNPTLGRVFKL